jgi:histidinol phosphatase-like enzyme
LCLHSQEDQDLCVCAVPEELIFNMSSEHQTVDLSNKCMTKDFLRDFRHGYTVNGGQEDHTFDIQLAVDT